MFSCCRLPLTEVHDGGDERHGPSTTNCVPVRPSSRTRELAGVSSRIKHRRSPSSRRTKNILGLLVLVDDSLATISAHRNNNGSKLWRLCSSDNAMPERHVPVNVDTVVPFWLWLRSTALYLGSQAAPPFVCSPSNFEKSSHYPSI